MIPSLQYYSTLAWRNLDINPRGTIFNRTAQCLAYADDVVVIGRSLRVLNDIVAKLQSSASEMGLEFNYGKTKYINNKS